MKRDYVFALVLILSICAILIYVFKSDKRLFAISGFEQNQIFEREEYYKKEVPRLYFKKLGYDYLIIYRYDFNKIDKKIADFPLFILFLAILI